MSLSTTGKRIRQLREKRGLTQSQMAEQLGMNPANFSSYERDKSVSPSDTLAKIADILGTTTDYLLLRSDNPLSDMAIYSHSFTEIPLVGTICAGDGILAAQNIEDYVVYPFPRRALPDYALRVIGDSMIGAGITNDDIVFLRKASWAEYNGQIVAVIINGEDGTLKRMKWSEGSPYIKLIPENPKYETKEVLPNEVMVCGVYSGHFRLNVD